MSEVWWGKESPGDAVSRLKRVGPTLPPRPELAPTSRQDVKKELLGRVKSFTPEWTNLRSTDAGIALMQLFSEQIEPVLERLNRLPEKAFIEFLNLAGIRPLQASAAAALLEFEVSDTAPQSVFISKGFQVGAQPAEGPDDIVIFETERDLVAAPLKIAELHVQQDNLFQSIDPQAANPAPRSSSDSRPKSRPGRRSRSAFVSPHRPARRRRWEWAA
jgi:hypothetical protein